MKHLYILLSLLTMVSSASADEPMRERIEWIDIWVTDADKTELSTSLTCWRYWHSGDGVHFNGKGKEAQAKQVAKLVSSAASSSQ